MGSAFGRISLAFAFTLVSVLTVVSRAEALWCPISVWQLVPMPDGKSYGATLRSKEQGTADVMLTLFSDVASYTVTIPHVVFDRKVEPLPGRTGPDFYVASPTFVSLPQPDALVMLRVDFIPGEHETPPPCLPAFTRSDSSAPSATMPPVPSSPVREELKGLLLELFPRSHPEVATMVERHSPLACAQPNAYARTLEIAHAAYPAAARAVGATGRVTVKVDLLPSGAVASVVVYRSSGDDYLDGAALRAAALSKYAAELYRCLPISGTYLFVVDFSR